MVTSMPSLAAANASASAAREVRAEWLFSLQIGLCSVPDIVAHACEPEGRPLLRLGLVRLLEAQDRWSRTSAINTINQTLRILGKPELTPREAAKLNVQWLVDARSGGRRQLALADALDRKANPPWAGFPYSPQQKGQPA
jgi:hypothetical protein